MPIIGYDIALAIIAITISIAGMILGIGFAMDDKKIKEFGKTELYTAIINAVILGSLIAAFGSNGLVTAALSGITSSVSQGYTCPSQMAYNSALCFAYNYVAGTSQPQIYNSTYPTVFDSTITLLVPLASVYTTLSIINSISITLGPISLGLSGSMRPLLTAISYGIDALTISLMSVELQGILLMFISATAMSVLLPVGIVLRCLYFTRRLGGAIMAITIGLFAVFPMTYVLNATVINSYATTFSPSNIASAANGATGLQNNIIAELSSYQSGHVSSFNAFNYITGAVSGLIEGTQQFIEGLSNFIAIIVMQAFILPALSVILTVISIRELARILGSEIDLGRFSII